MSTIPRHNGGAEILRGVGVSPGIAIGPALVLEGASVPVFRIELGAKERGQEVDRFKRALRTAARQLRRLRDRVRRDAGEPSARVFQAQLLILKDPALQDETVVRIQDEGVNASWALRQVLGRYGQVLRHLAGADREDPAADIGDVETRIQTILAGASRRPGLEELTEDVIIISRVLSPSDAAEFSRTRVIGLAIDGGGPTSHTAILANALGIPAVVGLRAASTRVRDGDRLILDGSNGTLQREPSESDLEHWRSRQVRQQQREQEKAALRDEPAITRDGLRVTLMANLELPEELQAAEGHGAEGIGLYRSEFLYLRCAPALPTEGQHYRIYRELAERVMPHEVVIRTLDLGGEEYSGTLLGQREPNPVLGLRGIRLSLDHEELLRTQVRGILRAAEHGKVRLMLPMVSGPDELHRARRIISEVGADLRREGVLQVPEVPLGIMVEVPAAALVAERLARHVDFFAIGTNDLIQYTLAIDRGNASVSTLYRPLHPAVLGLIRRVVEAAASRGLRVSVCGEMAADPVAAVVLVGLGIHELSMSPAAIPAVKQTLRSVSLDDTRPIVEEALQLDTVSEIEERVRGRILPMLPSELTRAL